MPRFPRHALFLPALLLAVLLGAACARPDASRTTSPSGLALIGTATGNASYAPEGAPPGPVPAPPGWEFDLGNVRFSKLEDGAPALQIVTQVKSQAGTALEFWITGSEGPLLRWSGGATRRYDGVFCFQLRLQDNGEALSLRCAPYRFTMLFRDIQTDQPVVSKTIEIAGFQPKYDGAPPGPNSPVARDLLGCPRSVI